MLRTRQSGALKWVLFIAVSPLLAKLIIKIIIQQIVTMPIYGKEALNICHPYMTDIQRYT